jgi:hypothetical protein
MQFIATKLIYALQILTLFTMGHIEIFNAI